VTETVSEPGRVTWNGPCATAECRHQVYAKRIPKDLRPAEDDQAVAAQPERDDAVREVSFDVPQPKRGRDDQPQLPDEHPPAGDGGQQPVPAAGDPAGEPEPVAVPVILDTPEPRRELPRRHGADLIDQRGRAEQRPQRRIWRHPLDW
jgi:hypothetical protein